MFANFKNIYQHKNKSVESLTIMAQRHQKVQDFQCIWGHPYCHQLPLVTFLIIVIIFNATAILIFFTI